MEYTARLLLVTLCVLLNKITYVNGKPRCICPPRSPPDVVYTSVKPEITETITTSVIGNASTTSTPIAGTPAPAGFTPTTLAGGKSAPPGKASTTTLAPVKSAPPGKLSTTTLAVVTSAPPGKLSSTTLAAVTSASPGKPSTTTLAAVTSAPPGKPSTTTLATGTSTPPGKPSTTALAPVTSAPPGKLSSTTLAVVTSAPPGKLSSTTLAAVTSAPPGKPSTTALAAVSSAPPGKPSTTTLATGTSAPPGIPSITTLAAVTSVPPGKASTTTLAPVTSAPPGKLSSTTLAVDTSAPPGKLSSTTLAAVTFAPYGKPSTSTLAAVTSAPPGKPSTTTLATGTSVPPGKTSTTTLAVVTSAPPGKLSSTTLAAVTSSPPGKPSTTTLAAGTSAPPGKTSTTTLAAGTSGPGKPSTTTLAAGTSFAFLDDEECICGETTTLSNDGILVTDTTKLSISTKFNVSIAKTFPTAPTKIKELQDEFNSTLYNVFSTLTGFKGIKNLTLRSGSVICDYTIVFKGDTELTKVKEEFGKKTKELQKSSIGDFQINTGTMDDTFSTIADLQHSEAGDACALYEEDVQCNMGYNCYISDSNTVKCKPKCDNYDCGHGQCVFDHFNQSVLCSCNEDDEYTYSGGRCETKTEKLALSKDYIIAISAGCGGFIVVVFSIILIVILLRRQRTKKSPQNDASNFVPDLADRNNKFQSRQDYNNRSGNDYVDIHGKSKRSSYSDNQAYEMPLYVRGREHDYNEITEYDGTKAFIYSPTQQKQTTRYAADRASIGSSLQDFPQEKVDIPRARIGRW